MRLKDLLMTLLTSIVTSIYINPFKSYSLNSNAYVISDKISKFSILLNVGRFVKSNLKQLFELHFFQKLYKIIYTYVLTDLQSIKRDNLLSLIFIQLYIVILTDWISQISYCYPRVYPC